MSFAPLIQEMAKMLSNLDGWIEKAREHAKAKSFELDTLLTARLAPDQFPLVRQIQSACDAAKFAAARSTGKEAPKHPDTEATFAELKTRIAAVVEYLKTFKAEDFAGAEDRPVPLGFMPGKGMRGGVYVREMAVPNFFFHVSHAYAILRHNGVPLGKMDYIGPTELIDV
ncbi:MAG: DUF1993 domain-containing protein [Polyangiaceae bacterium]